LREVDWIRRPEVALPIVGYIFVHKLKFEFHGKIHAIEVCAGMVKRIDVRSVV
jgi:hypothetical protein